MAKRKLDPRSVIERVFEHQQHDYLDFVVPEEQRSAEEEDFLKTLKKEVDQRLFPSHGLKLVAAQPNVTNQGYRFMFLDRERRRFYCAFTYDEAIKVFEELPEGDAGRFLIEMVCDRALAAREKHFATETPAEASLESIIKEYVPEEKPAAEDAGLLNAAPAGITLH